MTREIWKKAAAEMEPHIEAIRGIMKKNDIDSMTGSLDTRDLHVSGMTFFDDDPESPFSCYDLIISNEAGMELARDGKRI